MKIYDLEVWVQEFLTLRGKLYEYLQYLAAFSGEKYFPISTL
jgi:hypothetical protein